MRASSYNISVNVDKKKNLYVILNGYTRALDIVNKSVYDFLKNNGNLGHVSEDTKNIHEQLENIDGRLIKAYQKVGLVKYDAFKEIGGKLSFVLVLLTAENDGFLINSMHSTHEGCYTYTKEIVNGEAFVILSEEEQQALEEAKTNSSPLFKKKI